jgi:hypothetical protein
LVLRPAKRPTVVGERARSQVRSGSFAPLSSSARRVRLSFDSLRAWHLDTHFIEALGLSPGAGEATAGTDHAVGEFVPDYEATWWTGLGVPKNTPMRIVDKLNEDINAALADPNDRPCGFRSKPPTIPE